MEQTRRRIVEAAVELHRTVGPARSTISAIAEAAGVQRHTVYRHFPDERSLFAACTARYLGELPLPDPDAFRVGDPDERLRRALGATYARYAADAAGLANITRDAEVLPGLVGVGLAKWRERMRDVLAEGWPVQPSRRRRVEAAIAHVLDFATWRSLARGLPRDEVIDVAASFVAGAAGFAGRRPIRARVRARRQPRLG